MGEVAQTRVGPNPLRLPVNSKRVPETLRVALLDKLWKQITGIFKIALFQ